MLASQEGHVEIFDRLIQHGATVDLQREVNYTTEVQNTQRSIRKCNNNRTCKVVDASCPYYYTCTWVNVECS